MPRPGWLERQRANSERNIAEWPWWMKRLMLAEQGRLKLFLVMLTDSEADSNGDFDLKIGVLEENAEKAVKRLREYYSAHNIGNGRVMMATSALPVGDVPGVSIEATISVLRHIGIQVLDTTLK